MSWFWSSKTKGPTRMCPNGHVMEANWVSCAYCAPPAPRTEPSSASAGGPARSASKTQLLAKPTVVGWLVALDGKHKGEDFRIIEGKNKIGKNADCQVVLTDDGISGEHALVTFDKDDKHFIVADLGSLNGTFVYEAGDYKKVSSRELLDNDTIKLGETHFRFKCLD
jgi:pSer/pThr/pTyr-binding forkhead associated (FHA) protein